MISYSTSKMMCGVTIPSIHNNTKGATSSLQSLPSLSSLFYLPQRRGGAEVLVIQDSPYYFSSAPLHIYAKITVFNRLLNHSTEKAFRPPETSVTYVPGWDEVAKDMEVRERPMSQDGTKSRRTWMSESDPPPALLLRISFTGGEQERGD